MKLQYICNVCGNLSHKWSGKCLDCNAWGSMEEHVSNKKKEAALHYGAQQSLELLNSDLLLERSRIITQFSELNRVLGGGLVEGCAIVIGGDPGIGKSTLLLQLITSLVNDGMDCLYITGEESTNQIKLRASRLNVINNQTKLLASNSLEDIISTLDANSGLKLVIIDSIQTINTNKTNSSAGTISQIRIVSHELIAYAKKNNIILILACHVTKDGQLAGPKVLEHMVDTVLYFEGDHNNHFRILRSIKNRFGSVNEIGVFEMTQYGLKEITNPSELFIMNRDNNISGSAIFAGIEGSRPLLIEVQALIAPCNMPMPRRSVVGWDANRLAMILAVLVTRCQINLSNYEVYLSVTGGIRINEPAADLAVAAALISARFNRAVKNNTVFFSEIGLSGEVRRVNQPLTRIKEAVKLGFDNVVCSTFENLDSTQNVISIKHIQEIRKLFT